MKNDMSDLEQIAYAKTVYGQEEIDAVLINYIKSD